MAINRSASNYRLREDLIESLTPETEVQASIVNPALPGKSWRPAAWLPIVFEKTSVQAGSDAYVISKSKPVAFDSEGRIVPAGIRAQLGGDSETGVFAGTVLTYTATDVEWKVTDLVTGEDVAAAVTYTGEEVADALIERGLVREADVIATAGGAVPVTTDAHVNIVINLFISRAIGIAAYDMHTYSGRAEDNDMKFTNYSKQHSVQFMTEMELKVPHRVAGEETSDTFDFDALDTAGSETYAAGTSVAAGEYWEAAEISQLARYSDVLTASSPVVALGLASANVAKNTTRTPVTCDRDGVLVRERKAPQDIAREGDWYLDHSVGVMFLHTDTWATIVALGTVNTNFLYSFYVDTGLADSAKFPYFDGPCRPGDFVTYDEMSNFTVATAAQIAAGQVIVGRVLGIVREPMPLMDQVKTAWNLRGMTSASQMPGSATQGYTDLITLCAEPVADQVVILNVRI